MPTLQVFPHSTTVSLAKHQIDPRNNWLAHLAPFNTGIFYFGEVHPAMEDNVFVRKALMTTSHVFRHFLRPRGLELEVINEVVYLRGNVPADVVVIMAEQLAKQIDGVDNICNETNKVQDAAYAARRVKTAIHAESDQELSHRLQILVSSDSTLAPLGLQVEVSDDKATISGTVPSEAHSDWLQRLCQDLEGAHRVDLRLKEDESLASACCTSPLDNDSVETLFHTRLKLLKCTKRLRVETSARHRRLLLRGILPDAAAKELVESIAASTCGVREVTSELVVAGV